MSIQPKTHNLKIWPEHFDAVASGVKRFELRFDDRGFNVGDRLVLREWNLDMHTGRSCERVVSHILKWFEGLSPGWVVLGIDHLPHEFDVITDPAKIEAAFEADDAAQCGNPLQTRSIAELAEEAIKDAEDVGACANDGSSYDYAATRAKADASKAALLDAINSAI